LCFPNFHSTPTPLLTARSGVEGGIGMDITYVPYYRNLL
jgi:hypothetical protein